MASFKDPQNKSVGGIFKNNIPTKWKKKVGEMLESRISPFGKNGWIKQKEMHLLWKLPGLNLKVKTAIFRSNFIRSHFTPKTDHRGGCWPQLVARFVAWHFLDCTFEEINRIRVNVWMEIILPGFIVYLRLRARLLFSSRIKKNLSKGGRVRYIYINQKMHLDIYYI